MIRAELLQQKEQNQYNRVGQNSSYSNSKNYSSQIRNNNRNLQTQKRVISSQSFVEIDLNKKGQKLLPIIDNLVLLIKMILQEKQLIEEILLNMYKLLI